MRVTLANGAVEVAAQVPEQVELGGSSSWALHVPAALGGAPAQGTLYYKRSVLEPHVDVIQLGSGAHSTVSLPFEGLRLSCVMACTGDGKLVITESELSRGSLHLYLCDLSQPQIAPQLLAGGGELGQQPCDVLPGQQAAFTNIQAMTIGPGGELWVYEDWSNVHNAESSRVACVGTTLVPSTCFPAPQPAAAATDADRWEVAGSASDLQAAYERILASGKGADVHIGVSKGCCDQGTQPCADGTQRVVQGAA